MTKILLRPVIETDLPILFQQQLEPEAVAMSAYPAKDRGEFMRHWEGILKNKNVTARTIVYKEKIAGHIICWKEGKYEQRIGYWIGKEFWRRGIASAAVAEMLVLVNIRPLFAEVANHNTASKRVLEKNGFERLDDGGKISMWRLDK
ncbi:MAG TPA: GNAT family N-acetyltransferase [Anaerolineales bacterium]|nr:GNAT family N-acetyltransferase [Anaerolineales bacterium]HMX21162.1 GNAT family N-acetyltransferase [Anaerolineales bacterium]HMZ44971.1 GNAT family N-acetyltransferase [Anaerolineales bacterium]HNA56408.1 GNAT family N-acetyltransferase [Anaerolineales bacterium]HNF36970.1 GNAT family N-acetyltransferase [Anaerolineales bacterium]